MVFNGLSCEFSRCEKSLAEKARKTPSLAFISAKSFSRSLQKSRRTSKYRKLHLPAHPHCSRDKPLQVGLLPSQRPITSYDQLTNTGARPCKRGPMSVKLNYTRDELFADPEFASRIKREGNLYHGGLAADGTYLPPRSLHRIDAIKAWTAQLADAGHPTKVMTTADLPNEFFPNTDQAKHLLRNGAKGAMCRILTMIGLIEGFGNDGLKLFPRMPWQPFFVEDLDGTCLNHLPPLFDAHGHDEAGSDYKGYHECGHDEMWYTIRDAALDDPIITDDMFENLPIGPPPGYTGKAKASSEALDASQLIGAPTALAPGVPPMFGMLVTAMTSLLAIELIAYTTFAWAHEVLSDSTCSADPEFAGSSVDYIADDETIHVSYLQCALAEIRCRTIIGEDTSKIPGSVIVDEAVKRTIANQSGSRFNRIMAHRLHQVEEELALRSDGEKILQEFLALGPVPV